MFSSVCVFILSVYGNKKEKEHLGGVCAVGLVFVCYSGLGKREDDMKVRGFNKLSYFVINFFILGC